MAELLEKRSKTVLVTGGNGIVGSHVVDAFLEDRTFDHVIATLHQHRQWQNPKAYYRLCDLNNRKQVMSLVEKARPQIIVHTVSPGPFAPAKSQYRVNYLATKQLLEIAFESPWVKAFVYTSSIEAVVLKSGLKSRHETEDDAVLHSLTSGPSAYARTKGAADALVLSFNTGKTHTTCEPGSSFKESLLTSSLRIGGLYGERDEKTIAKLLKLVNTVGARIQIGPNKAIHDWVYTKSTAQAHVLASKALLEDNTPAGNLRVDGEAFFITDGSPIPFWDFSRKVLAEGGDRKLAGQSPVKIVQIPFGIPIFFAGMGELIYKVFTLGHKAPKMGRHHFYFMKNGCWCSIDKARERLGYNPRHTTEDGIRFSVRWFQDDQSGITDKTTKEAESISLQT